ncbi:Unknown protein sequence [Pseudomonas syringae pv. maculicola]|nr:Unknown protein sequence [Pseudomonas savastanoi pv. phaseolicola]KPB74776.1 Unknown protein sequence [Pseudomonas amygdali pv. mellea]KPB86276.1 Unknown protein sequence [Pseudomonas syringae pv. maculicola]RMQ67985.1 hypothetical protein ALQ01_102548 [Pseudomonas savastanoi pv. glycinea]KPB46455.1 Unknown protein sequence [Pseudomonas savastanoi pv. phaseolicola]
MYVITRVEHSQWPEIRNPNLQHVAVFPDRYFWSKCSGSTQPDRTPDGNRSEPSGITCTRNIHTPTKRRTSWPAKLHRMLRKS